MINILKGRKQGKRQGPIRVGSVTLRQVQRYFAWDSLLSARVHDGEAFWQFVTTQTSDKQFQFYKLNPPSFRSKNSKTILTHFSNTIFRICDLFLQLLHGPKWAALSGCHSGMTFVKVTRFFMYL